jgi:hypothetical protein
LKVIASIEEPELIEHILAHRRERGEEGRRRPRLGRERRRRGRCCDSAGRRRARGFQRGRRAVLRAVWPEADIGRAYALKFCRHVRCSAGSPSRSAGGFDTMVVKRRSRVNYYSGDRVSSWFKRGIALRPIEGEGVSRSWMEHPSPRSRSAPA